MIELDKDSAARITDFKKGIPGFDRFYDTIRTDEPLPASLFESYPQSKPVPKLL